MGKFRINAQEHIIKNFIECLENSMTGMGIARSWVYTLINESTLEFILKEDHELKPADLLWFGYFTAIE